MKSGLEKLQWMFTLLNTAKDIFDSARGVNEAIPQEWKNYLLGINKTGKGKNDEIVFMEVVLNSGLKIDEIESIEKFMEALSEVDEGKKLEDFILFVAKGASEITRVKTESGTGTSKKVSEKEERAKGKVVEFVRRIASKSSFDEQMKICDLYRIWEKKETSPILVLEKTKAFLSNLAPTDAELTELERKYEESKKNRRNRRQP